MTFEFNIISIFLAAVGSMALGFWWYSPAFLGKPWMELMGYTDKSIKEAQKKMGPMYALSFVAALVTAAVLSMVINGFQEFFNYSPLFVGLVSGFLIWLGFVGPVQMTDVIFGNKSWKLWKINTGYQLVSLLVMGAIIAIL